MHFSVLFRQYNNVLRKAHIKRLYVNNVNKSGLHEIFSLVFYFGISKGMERI